MVNKQYYLLFSGEQIWDLNAKSESRLIKMHFFFFLTTLNRLHQGDYTQRPEHLETDRVS